MKKINQLFDRLFKIIPGGVFALISMSIGLSCILISMLNYPGYSMVSLYVSYLGIGPGLSAPIFNIGLILSGLTAVPFFVYLGRVLKYENVNEQYRRNSTIIAVVGCLALSLVGIFPACNLILLAFHGTFAAIFFMCGLIFCIAYSYLMWYDPRFPRAQSYFGFIVAGIFASFIFTLNPIFEWLIFFAIVTWVFETGILTLYKKL